MSGLLISGLPPIQQKIAQELLTRDSTEGQKSCYTVVGGTKNQIFGHLAEYSQSCIQGTNYSLLTVQQNI